MPKRLSRAGLLMSSVRLAVAAGIVSGSFVVTTFAAGPAIGVITTLAGTGTAGFNGDLGLATAAQLNEPTGVAVDAAGNVYIADQNNHRIRKVTAATGVISTVAGTGIAGFLGDGGIATGARLSSPSDIALDAAGNLYIADTFNNRIRKVTAATGVITTVAGSGSLGFGGDGGVATAAQLNRPFGLTLDSAGNLYIADQFNHRIRKVTATTGIISTLAGNGTGGYNGDGLATGVSLQYPADVAVDAAGNAYIADESNHRVRKVVQSTGVLSTVAGTGQAGYAGEAGPATAARLYNPLGVEVDAAGNVYITDQNNDRIRKLTVATGILNTIAGSANQAFGGDGGEATAAQLNFPRRAALDASGSLFIADGSNNRVRKVGNPVGTLRITTVAGNGTGGYNGDGPATGASLQYPAAAAVDSAGNIYIADQWNHRVRKVTSSTGVISTVAGTGVAGFLGEAGPATAARLYLPQGLAVDAAANIYIADTNNHRIRKVTAATGIITTVAGSGNPGFVGDGGVGTAAQLNYPAGVAVDAAGNLYIADESNNRIRKVIAGTGVIMTIAGTGTAGVGGDGGPATTAQLNHPTGVAVDTAANVYIADQSNHRIRKIAVGTGTMSTVAGTGIAGYDGEAGLATAARLFQPSGVAVDAAGNVYIADSLTYRIRKLMVSTGVITTVAGNGTPLDFGGDGGAATAGSLDRPSGVAVDAAGNLFIADQYNHRIRKASIPLAEPTNLTATVLNATTVRLDWTAAPGASTYNIKRGTSSGGEVVIATGVFATTFTDTPLTTGGTYYYVVSAVSGGEESVNSNEASARLTTLALMNDFDADGRTDITVYRPSAGQWFIRFSSQGYSGAAYGFYSWGLPGDLPISGDFDGDRRTDPTVYRPSTGQWFILYSSQGYNSAIYGLYQWGLPGDVPIATDFDGDGRLDLTVYRPSTGEWFIRYSSQGYNVGTYAAYQWGLYGDVPLPGDFDGDGRTDLAVYRPATSQWFIRFSSLGYNPGTAATYQWGFTADVPLIADFDGDRKTDLTVYRPSTNQWFIRYSTLGYSLGATTAYQWGLSGDLPVVLDLDGDGKTELTVFRPTSNEWFVRYSSVGYNVGLTATYQWGLVGDLALPKGYDGSGRTGDVDGDAKADLTVYRPSTGQWLVRQSQSGFSTSLDLQWGLSDDVPLSSDFDGDRLTDLTVYRPSTGEWYIRYSTQAYSLATYSVYQWGLPGDTPLGADVDGDGKADLIVFRPSTGHWFIRYSRQGYAIGTYGLYQWGLSGDVPLAADVDGDGKADLIVFRPSTGQWFIRYSTLDYSAVSYGVYQWGLFGDVPIAADFDGDGKVELTVFRPSTAQWFILYSALGYSPGAPGVYQWGLSTDTPLARDFDGDGRAELSVYRPSTAEWFIRYSLTGYSLSGFGYYQWGLIGDYAVVRP